MKTSDIYLLWANPESQWSAWVKPVLFAFMRGESLASTLPSPNADLSWVPSSDSGVAFVVDLPGAEGVVFGTELARRGYRPVPLYNALPWPVQGGSALVPSAVDVASIVRHLRAATVVLSQLRIPRHAPPAFLLDANRRVARFKLDVGDFDNRSVCFPTDFPSGKLLREHGIKTVIVVEQSEYPDADLARVLIGWEAEGIALLRKDARSGPAEPLHISRPRWWQRVWHDLTVRFGLRRSGLDSFGAIVPPTGG